MSKLKEHLCGMFALGSELTERAAAQCLYAAAIKGVELRTRRAPFAFAPCAHAEKNGAHVSSVQD